MNRWTFCSVLGAVFVVVSSLPAPAQPPRESKVLRSPYGDILFTPASRVLRTDGSLKGDYAEGLTGEARGDLGEPAGIGWWARYWQSEYREKFESARALGLRDGDLLDSRSYCTRDEMTISSGEFRSRFPPETFKDWVAQTAALIETRVVALTPGFNRAGEPKLLVSLSVERHFYPPKKLFAQRLHVIMPIGEFVAGDAVFCARATWGGYRPRMDDRLVVAVFGGPFDPDHSLLHVPDANRVFLVGDDDALIRLNRGYEKGQRLTRSFFRVRSPSGDPSADVVKWQTDGFPVTLSALVEEVHAMWDSGALDHPSFSDLLREEREKANRGRKREGGWSP